jgi:2-C-methyl-D-erythritol 4-phosphate cytidylyltransferase
VYYGLLRVEDLVGDQFTHTVVVVHDGVRPFFTNEMLRQAMTSAAELGSGVCCVPVKSSIRMRTAHGSKAVDRALFYHVQTPQCFRLPQLLASYEEADPDVEFTDDASLFEAAGHEIHIVEGHYDNLKLTTPEDLLVAEALLQRAAVV